MPFQSITDVNSHNPCIRSLLYAIDLNVSFKATNKLIHDHTTLRYFAQGTGLLHDIIFRAESGTRKRQRLAGTGPVERRNCSA